MLKPKRRRKLSPAQVRAISGLPSIPEIKKNFRKRMAQLAEEAKMVENEEHRSNIMGCIQYCLIAVKPIRDWYELLDFVKSEVDALRIAIAAELYGILDPRTEKLMKRAQGNAMEFEMMRDLRIAD